MLLIYPPVAKPSEPPAGLARLSGALNSCGIPHKVIDANAEGILYLLESGPGRPAGPADTWTVRSFRNLQKNLASVRDLKTYSVFDRYKRTVVDLNHALERSSGDRGATVGLANYQQAGLSPLRSSDLIRAAGEPELNPFFRYFSRRLLGLLEESQPSTVGFSLNYLSQAVTAFSMIGYLGKVSPGIKIVLGGGLVTSWMSRPSWNNPFQGLVDLLVAGPGEHMLLSLCGVSAGDKTHFTPDYDGLRPDGYLSPGFILPYSASSGCYWKKCSFCPENAEDNPYRPIPAGRVREDLDGLLRKTRPVLMHLLDNAVSMDLMRSLCKDPPGVPWYGFARFTRHLADPDFCSDLRRSGCVMLKLGLESGDQDVLDLMHKGIDIETASAVLKTLKKAGIATYVYLLFGTPAETPAAAKKTLDFIAGHRDEIGFMNLAIFNMPVCGPETPGLATGSFYEGDLSLYTDFAHPEGWDRRSVRKFLDDEFKRHRAISPIVKRDPPIFTSNHAPFFVMK